MDLVQTDVVVLVPACVLVCVTVMAALSGICIVSYVWNIQDKYLSYSGNEISKVYSRYRASWQKLSFYWFQCMYRLPRLCISVYSSLQRRKIIHAEDTELESFLLNMSGICHIWTSISRSYMKFMFSALKQSKQSWSWQRASDHAWNRPIWDIWHDTNTHEATFNNQGVVV